MSAAVLRRATLLAGIALWREVGRVAVVGCLLLAGVASIQEPRFFRLGEGQLTWSTIYASADLAALVVCASSLPADPESARTRCARALACLGFSAALLITLMAATCLADSILASPTPWSAMPQSLLRFILLWSPLCVLAQLPLGGGAAMVQRSALLVAAFLVQCGVHRASLQGGATVPQVLSSILATAGGLLAFGGRRR